MDLVTPEDIWPLDNEYADLYWQKVATGRAVAKDLHACIVAIARNAMPMLPNTLELVKQVQAGFRGCDMFVYENDSTDGTNTTLDDFAAAHDWFTVQHAHHDREDSRGFEKSRTMALAQYRTICQDWVREHASGTSVTIVLDVDPAGGFSVDGVFNSLAWLGHKQTATASTRAGAMASCSLMIQRDGEETKIAHYDSWAARPLSWWRDRREEIAFFWFSTFIPPVGSPPAPFNSAFGGLCLYDTEAYLSGRYDGNDCEHVGLRRSMREAGYQLYLNPGCRYVAVIQQ